MKVAFTGLDLKTKYKDFKKKQDEEIINNVQKKWDRKKCNIAFFTVTSVLVDCFTSNIITKQIIKKTNINTHSMALNSIVGIVIIGFGLLSGYIFNKIDKKRIPN